MQNVYNYFGVHGCVYLSLNIWKRKCSYSLHVHACSATLSHAFTGRLYGYRAAARKIAKSVSNCNSSQKRTSVLLLRSAAVSVLKSMSESNSVHEFTFASVSGFVPVFCLVFSSQPDQLALLSGLTNKIPYPTRATRTRNPTIPHTQHAQHTRACACMHAHTPGQGICISRVTKDSRKGYPSNSSSAHRGHGWAKAQGK